MGLVATIASGIETVLDTVTDVGVTFDYQPLPARDWASFVDSFSTTVAGYDSGNRHIRAWTVSYLGEERERRMVGIGATKVDRHTRWLIRGYLSWNDPGSDAAFRDLVEAVATKLDESRTLSGSVQDHTAVAVTLPNNGDGVMFGDHLAHYVELRFTAKDVDTLTTS